MINLEDLMPNTTVPGLLPANVQPGGSVCEGEPYQQFSQNDSIAAAAVFLHRMLGQDDLVFQCAEKYVHSRIYADMNFVELREALVSCEPREIVAQVLGFAPFQVNVLNGNYDQSMMQWWPGHFEKICATLAKTSDLPIKRFCFMDDTERELVVNTWNQTQWDFPDWKMLHEFIEEKCQEAPHREAVRFAGRGITYEELNARANQLAHSLRSEGIGRDSLVTICMDRSIELVVGLLAILKAGGAYVPMDPSYPEERLLYILADSQSKVLLTQRSFAPRFADTAEKVIFIDQAEDLSCYSKENPEIINTADDLCYVIYTSGSTGKPKGAGNIHKGVVNRILWMHDQYRLDISDRVLQKTPFGFDVSVWEFFWPLMAGATLVMAEPEIHKDAEALASLIEREKIAILHFVPSMLDLFLEADVSAKCGSLKKVFTSGEALSKDIEKRFFNILSAELHNLYGPTEASIDVTYWRCQPHDAHMTVPIGYPIANTQIYILDEFLQPAPIGSPGELYIGGTGLARGYSNRPELTQEKFIAHPFQANARVYRTGDLCRFLGDGAIEYIGRIDHQIKLRGFRIELGEIETALRKHPQVKSVAVIAREDVPGQKYLAAYIVSLDQSIEAELISRLQCSLPEYMVPSAFVFLPILPLSPNGKLDVKNLPKPKEQGHRSEVPVVLPRNVLESTLREVWREVLGIQNVCIRNGFFSLGGHSLKAMQLVLRIKRKLNKPISLPEIFSHPTIEQQAELLQSREENDAKEQGLHSDPVNRWEPFLLTDIQKAYLIGRTEAFSLGGIWSHVYAENVRGQIDLPRLENALNLLIQRHDMLRAVILEDGTQRVLIQTPRYRIREEQKEKEQVREEMRSKQWRSDAWPLFDVRVSNDRVHFLFDLLIADGTGLEIIFEELSRLYDNKKMDLPPLKITYRDCILAMAAQEHEKARKYWFNRIDTLPDAPELPVRNSAQAGPFMRHKGELSAKEWKAVQQRAANAGVSPAAYLVTLYGEAIKAYSRSAHFTLNVMFFNRPPLHPDIDQVVGNFSTTLLLEMDLRDQGSKAQKVQQQLLEDLDHAAFNGIKVLNEKNRRQGGSTAVAMPIIFACALNLRPENGSCRVGQRFEWYGKTVPYNHLETPQVLLDHQVFEEKDGSLCFHWDVRDGHFCHGVIEAMFQIYLDLLKEEKNSKRLPLHGHKEIDRISPAPAEKCLHEAFFERALQHPERAAVISRKKSLTYGQLAATSLHLSERLETLSLQADDHIAIIMEKGWEQTAAVLGIHAAGAAYLPIDSALPEARIRNMLSISQARAAILQQPLPFEIDIPCFFIELKENAKAFTCKQDPSDLAYTIFTSGSTGVPKGVMIEHKCALNTIDAINRKYGVNENDRCFASASLSFDLSVYDIFGFLSIGASMYIPGNEEDPTTWLQTIQKHQITIWNSTPALVQILADRADLYPPEKSTVRVFMMSGDWIPVPLPDRIRKHFLADVYSLGGATEASIWSNDYPIGKVDLSWPSIPYGKALANQTMVVLDEELEPRSVWATGMIYIGGIGLARGYLNDPEKTAKSFIVQPRTGQRLYRTGDLGRLHEDGNIEFLGREDLQVKVQGYRIELEEIESAIYRYEGVKQAAARIVGKKSEAIRIAAFFTASTAIESSLLEGHLAQLLPSYMIPHQLLQLESFPLSPNGKVDVQALVSKFSGSAATSRVYVAPEGALEESMAEIWSSLLNLPNIGRNDNFFALGGTSFLAFRMVFLMQKELGLAIPIAALFQKGTIAELAHLGEVHDDPSFVPLQMKGTKEPVFLVHPSGGGVLCYTELASLLSGRPIYAFQAPGLLDGRIALSSIEAMAEHYLKILLKKQPNGPYFIGGWSLGGVVAFEMAQRLQKMNKELAPVLLIDSPSPYTGSNIPDAAMLYRWFEEDYGEALLVFDKDTKESLFKVFCAHLLALRNYGPSRAPIDLIQLKAEVASVEHLERHPDKMTADWGWSRISTGRIEHYSFAATHASILQSPCVQEISAKIASIWG